jgi:deazaflavin-dependent oxidoreductase (nitroreductase family)
MTQADFTKALQDRNEISITVKGRRSGREVTLPVWFAREGSTVWLLPLHGSRTQWYRNVLADPTITVQAGRRALSVAGRPRTDRTVVQRVLDQFRQKYGTGDVARYYDHSDAVVELSVGAGNHPGTR